MGALKNGPLEHVVVTSLAERLAVWWAWLYRFQHYRKNGSLRIREDPCRHHFEHLLAAEPLTHDPHIIPEDDVAVLAPTGGTTASPKAVPARFYSRRCLRRVVARSEGTCPIRKLWRAADLRRLRPVGSQPGHARQSIRRGQPARDDRSPGGRHRGPHRRSD